MKDFGIMMIAIGLLLLVIGFTLYSIQEDKKSNEISGLVICFFAGLLLVVGLLVNSI